jgi:hypothetical protein
MMRGFLAMSLVLAAALAQAHDHMPVIDDSHPDAARIRMCSRMADVALQALNDRDKDRPMKTYREDGADEPKLANEIIQAVYAEPQISSPKKALTFGRARCNEFLLNQKN